MREGLSTDVRNVIVPNVFAGEAMHECTGGELQETEEGFLLEIPTRTTQEIIITSQYAHNHHTKFLIKAGEESKVNIIRRITGMNKGTVQEDINIKAAAGSIITYNEAQLLPKGKEWLSTKEGIAEKKAMINWYTQINGGKTNHHQIKNTLSQGAKAIVLCTTKLDGEQHSKATVQTIHKDKETKSGMYAKTIVSGRARTLHKGLVRIEEDASESSGYQQEDALIIGQGAEANVMPELEIENPNVRCSHGSTIGHVDEQQLFYLQSRGLSKDAATKLITKGFLHSITLHADEAWTQTINELLEEIA